MSALRFTGRNWIPGLLLVAAVLIAFWPALSGGFIWDDDAHVIANPCVVGPQGLWDIWSSSAARICPLVLSSFWLEYKCWGLNAWPYHLVNLLVHAGSAVVLWRVLLALGVRGAWLGAALWAVHPVQTESVAWITELKNTQSGLFYLLSVLFYVRMLRAQQSQPPGVAQICNLHPPPGEGTGEGAAPSSRGSRDYAWALVFGALGMASKTSVVVLPVVLGLCGWWVEGRWNWRRLKGLAPWVLLALGAAALALWTQHLEGANHEAWARSVPERIIAAGCVVWFYLGKLLWPHPLIFIYERWEIAAGNPLWWLPVLSLVVGFGLLWKGRARGWVRALLFGLGYFVVALVPVLGLADHYFLRYSFVGDHFQYLASMGPLALAGAGLAGAQAVLLAGMKVKDQRWVGAAVCVALLLVLGSLSWRECRKYRDDETLWRATLAQNPHSWMSHNNLGIVHNRRGEVEQAMKHWYKAIEINPRDAATHNNLGYSLIPLGREEEGLAEYRRALEIDPGHDDTNYNFGNYYLLKGQFQEAMAHFRKALERNPRHSLAHNNLGNAFLSIGNPSEAAVEFKKAMDLQPDDSAFVNNLAWVLATTTLPELRDGPRAVELAIRAVELSRGENPRMFKTLAAAHAACGDFAAAVTASDRASQAALDLGDFATASALATEANRYREQLDP